MISERLPDEINQTIYGHMDKTERATLSLKTQMEMARGALGRAVNEEETLAYVRMLGVLADGERELRKLISDGWRLFVRRQRRMSGDVVVMLHRSIVEVEGTLLIERETNKTLELTDPFEGFPSDELITKIMLVAG